MSDLSSDIGRIERQNLIIEATIDKAKSTYNPLRIAGFISSLTHDVTLDNKLICRHLVRPGRALPRPVRLVGEGLHVADPR